MMIRKVLIGLVVTILVLVFVSGTNAQTTTGSAAVDSATKLRQQMQLLQDQKREAIGEMRDESKASISARKAEFQARLLTIRDLKKRLLVEQIDAKIKRINEKMTTRFMDALIRIQTFLDKFNQFAGTNIVPEAVSAQLAIDAAKTAVDAQVAKTYTIEIGDDPTLKINVGKTVSQFRLDLTAVHKMVIDAKQAVQKLNTLKSGIRKEATSSANL